MITVWKFYKFRYYVGIDKSKADKVFTNKQDAEAYAEEYRQTGRYYRTGMTLVETLVKKDAINTL